MLSLSKCVRQVKVQRADRPVESIYIRVPRDIISYCTLGIPYALSFTAVRNTVSVVVHRDDLPQTKFSYRCHLFSGGGIGTMAVGLHCTQASF